MKSNPTGSPARSASASVTVNLNILVLWSSSGIVPSRVTFPSVSWSHVGKSAGAVKVYFPEPPSKQALRSTLIVESLVSRSSVFAVLTWVML